MVSLMHWVLSLLKGFPDGKYGSAMISDEAKDNRESYITMDHFASARIEEKKSVFHGWAGPIRSEQDAVALIEQAKRKYPDARHHVYAWILGGTVQRNKYSDDGEPCGTAGMPVFDVLRKNSIEDGILIVTRYFGGTLLGTGGLVHAYTEAALEALKKSEPIRMRRCLAFHLTTTYPDFEKIKRALGDPAFTIEVLEYGSRIESSVTCPENKKDALFRLIADASNGKASAVYIGSAYQKADFIVFP